MKHSSRFPTFEPVIPPMYEYEEILSQFNVKDISARLIQFRILAELYESPDIPPTYELELFTVTDMFPLKLQFDIDP